jgi:hypothetical protein
MRPLGGPKSGFHHSGKWSKYGKSLRTHPLSPIFPPFRAPPDPIDSLRILIQLLFAGGSKSINAPAFLALRFYEALVLQLLERRINGSGTGALLADPLELEGARFVGAVLIDFL